MPEERSSRWQAFWKRLGLKGDPSATYQDLATRYSEPHRAYHTLRHIEECLQEFEAVRERAQDEKALEMAIWYHDAIYNPMAKDNEEKSAALATEVAIRGGQPEAFADKVERLTLATKHREPPSDPDEALLLDIDLSILGQSAERFREYEEDIRKEYRFVPGPIFKAKRSRILKGFLDRPTLYSTQFFRERYEAAARRNLKNSLEHY